MARRCRQWPTTSRVFRLGLATLAVAATARRPAAAMSGFAPPPLLAPLKGGRRDWQQHPFGAKHAAPSLGLVEGLRQQRLDLDTVVGRMARERAGLPTLALIPLGEPEPLAALMRRTGARSRTYEPRLGNIALCGMTVRAHQLNDGELFIVGDLPDIEPGFALPSAADWPPLDAVMQGLLAALADRGDRTDAPRLLHAERCLEPRERGIRAAWRIQLVAGDLRYAGTADADSVYRIEDHYFSVTGSARIYEQNDYDQELIDAKLLELKGDGTLTGARWRVTVPEDYQAAVDPEHNFDYDPTDVRFIQPNVYYHLQLQQAYMASLGYEWPKDRTLQVRPHMNDDPNVGYNNAFFQPSDADTGDLGQIKLGDGDGSILRSLGTDADVVAHEFGHQVVYSTLKTVSRCYETLAVHEGLADFFAFARTKDPCLGESICPDGTQACVTQSCLRTADIDLKFGDTQWLAWSNNDACYTHRNGQLISALLWDLRADGKMTVDEVAKLMLKGVSYFKVDSGFRDLLLAIFTADRELFGGSHRTQIKAAIEARGLGSFVTDVAGEVSDLPELNGGGTLANGGGSLPSDTDTEQSSSTTPKRDADKKRKACGTAGSEHATPSAIAAIVLALPALAGLRRRRLLQT